MIVTCSIPIRLDRFLKRHYPKITNGIIQTMLRKKEIKINGIRVAKASTRLNQGDELTVFANIDQYKGNDVFIDHSLPIETLSKKILGSYLIFENSDFLVINKPAKLSSQGGTKVTLSIDHALKKLNQNGGTFKLVHRLDKETSGLMLIAKGYDAANRLSYGFREKKIYKTYLALTSGSPKGNSQGIIRYLDEITEYKLLKYDTIENISLVEFKPITGKEHQIRRHALIIDLHILGDKKYGNFKNPQKYMMLHSNALEIDKEIFGQAHNFAAPLPEYFKKLSNFKCSM